MTTEVSICNQGLGWLGANLITSLDDESREAQLCKANYQYLRDAVLEAGNWTFATQWFDLAKLNNPPLSEYANSFEIPSEVLRVMFCGLDRRHPTTWQREGNAIVTNDSRCRIQAIRRIDDPARFSTLFAQALAHRIAADLAIPLTNSRSLAETHTALYIAKMKEAESMDNSQGRSRRIRSRWLTGARAQGPRTMGPTV